MPNGVLARLLLNRPGVGGGRGPGPVGQADGPNPSLGGGEGRTRPVQARPEQPTAPNPTAFFPSQPMHFQAFRPRTPARLSPTPRGGGGRA